MVLRGEITTEKLINIYNAVNKLIKDKNCYYEDEEVENIKKNEKTILLKM